MVQWSACMVLAAALLLSGCMDATTDDPPAQDPPGTETDVLLGTYHFSGSVPAEDTMSPSTTIVHKFIVDEGVSKLNITLTSTYVGAARGYLSIRDPDGSIKTDNYVQCPGAASTDMTETCNFVVYTHSFGDWAARMEWQVGQATEDYDITVELIATVPAA